VGVGERANWKSDPYKALVKGGLVYGLGALSAFASLADMAARNTSRMLSTRIV